MVEAHEEGLFFNTSAVMLYGRVQSCGSIGHILLSWWYQ